MACLSCAEDFGPSISLPLLFHSCLQAKQYSFAKETLLKMDDTKGLISLYVEESQWDDAFLLLNAHPEASLVGPAAIPQPA